MNTQKLPLVETDQYWLAVSDEEIKDIKKYKGRYHLEKGSIINIFPDYLTDLSECKLIIAYRPKGNAPDLKGIDRLPEMIVEDGVEKLADLFSTDESKVHPADSYIAKQGFLEGHKAATKVYSQEDLRNAIAFGINTQYTNLTPKGIELEIEKFIQSLKQPKPKWFVAEIDISLTTKGESDYFNYDNGMSLNKNAGELKTTTINGYSTLKGYYL